MINFNMGISVLHPPRNILPWQNKKRVMTLFKESIGPDLLGIPILLIVQNLKVAL
jgi:hypothetical protein